MHKTGYFGNSKTRMKYCISPGSPLLAKIDDDDDDDDDDDNDNDDNDDDDDDDDE